jgi:hypothetical protein
MNKRILLGSILALAISSAAWAHNGYEYFLPEVPNPAGMSIDGSEDDWGWYDLNYAFTGDQMIGNDGNPVPLDDINVAMFVGWSAPPDNRYYLFGRVQDDTLKVSEEDQKLWWSDDVWTIAFDADHSGGPLRGDNLDENSNAQRYHMRILPLPGQPVAYNSGLEYLDQPELGWGSDIYNGEPTEWFEIAWTLEPAGAGNGSTDVSWTMEFRCALWDEYGLSPEESVRHVFEPGQIIGVSHKVNDRGPIPADAPEDTNPFRHNVYPEGGSGAQMVDANQMHDFLTIPHEGATAVESGSWGRIKAHYDRTLR